MGWLNDVRNWDRKTTESIYVWWRDEFLGPRNTWRFKMRIAMRVRWLRLKAWAGDQRRRDVRRHLPRPILLLALGVAIPLVVLWLLQLRFPAEVGGVGTAFQRLLTGGSAKVGPEALGWRDALQLLLLLVGLPSAFILWLFRDIHVNETLANQRKDVNLKEFQEIQMRAAGALDEKYPAHARETLQIAALHQLRSFLRGDYGDSFRRPAWELLRARMATSARETGTRAIVERVEAQASVQADASESPADRAKAKVAEIRRAIAALRPHAVADAELAVIREDYRFVFRADLPLTDTCFDRVVLSGVGPSASPLLASRVLSRCSFVAADLRSAHLEDANLSSAHFEGANLRGAHLESANLRGAHLEGANLYGAHLEAANLCKAHLEGANLFKAHLEAADLRWAHLEGADLSGAHLEGADLRWAHLEGGDLSWVHLEDANLSGTHLKGANLSCAHLEGAELYRAHLLGANLYKAHLEGADLSGAHLERAGLHNAHLEGANLSGANLKDAGLNGAIFDDATIFVEYWSERTEVEREAIRDEFRDRGMVHLYDPPPVDDPL